VLLLGAVDYVQLCKAGRVAPYSIWYERPHFVADLSINPEILDATCHCWLDVGSLLAPR